MFLQFAQNIDGFTGLLEFIKLYKQNPLEKFLIFTIYQNYTLALLSKTEHEGKYTSSTKSPLTSVLSSCSRSAATWALDCPMLSLVRKKLGLQSKDFKVHIIKLENKL